MQNEKYRSVLITFNNKTIIVTGGSSGIGRQAVIQFLEAGGRVIVLDKNEIELSSFDEDHRKNLYYYQCDLTKHAEIKNVFESISAEFVTIDVLVNNAGVQTYGTVVDTEEETWDLTMDVNLKSIYLCSKYTIPLMEKSSHPVIVNIGSAQGFVSQENVMAYATSKEAIHGLTRCIAIDYAPKIRCVAVCPGSVNTPMLQTDFENVADEEAIIEETRNIHLLQRIAEPEEVVNFVIFLASEKASFATGQTYRVDGGIGLKIGGQ